MLLINIICFPVLVFTNNDVIVERNLSRSFLTLALFDIVRHAKLMYIEYTFDRYVVWSSNMMLSAHFASVVSHRYNENVRVYFDYLLEGNGCKPTLSPLSCCVSCIALIADEK
jgi:hypothetical protein